ncbi:MULTISPECIES: transcription/translation regulatory transformer protein RfaH [Halomonas]|uniref:Transcription antitermination protein RfaH n=3 Tax=Halomonas TaxID=2745 RepID=A0AAU7KNA1_9GAMM|nr:MULTISPECIES: transcription/translation regulatory transformer protein RfaH [Halomonas]MBR9772865.1 transcription/translation regulatory transformer protein RfaH [Gammaproteobacteria bacterium]KJZ07568.1 antitermination protein NusG [Halomonas sp. S2151]MAR71228.1 transcription/translation regulatory transformer protein RfaH [Halomonas sp.]MBR9879641.1 transcription/translation regulatory transformer protein RfaH [Gammaproteobacteria bacterium]MBS8271217.1 transcription/translation regulato|tara:strand:- start:237 stop:779 length:543 start_codon:yes stop_codon:yes gene_type:complete
MSHSNIEAGLGGDATPRWYVVQCKGGESFRAAEHLANQGYELFHPVLEVQKKRRNKLTWVEEPLFPYYLFLRLDQVESNWRPIRSTRGVLKIVTFGLSMPVPVSDELIDLLRQHGEAKDDDPGQLYFRAGESVEITDGPFKDLKAVFESHKGEERAIVLLNMLHRQQRLEMPVAALKRQD